jgi:hypothetical protein
MQRLYLIYGLLILALLAWGEYRGWSFLPTLTGSPAPVPMSIRDNPGAYRAQYTPNARYVGGK